MIKLLSERYKRLESKERKQLFFILVCSLLAAYFFYAAKTWEEMFHAQKMANRKADRIEKRIGDIKAPELESGISESVLSKIQAEINDQEALLKEFANRQLPLDSSEQREELKLSITKLANVNQLRMTNLKSIGFGADLTLNELKGEELRSFLLLRPHFKLSLSGQYHNLMAFVEDLGKLKYQVYVDNVRISRLNDENSLLKIEMELKL